MLDRLARDAAQRHVSEQALRESEARFRSLIDNAPAGIHLKDLDGRYLAVNDEFAREANTRAEDVVGKTVGDLFSPAVKTRAYAVERRVLKNGVRTGYEFSIAGTVRKSDVEGKGVSIRVD